MAFKAGDKVKKTFIGLGGYTEEVPGIVVHHVEDGVAYLCESGFDPGSGAYETGITYNANTGKELENFFPGMTSKIEHETE